MRKVWIEGSFWESTGLFDLMFENEYCPSPTHAFSLPKEECEAIARFLEGQGYTRDLDRDFFYQEH